MAKKKRKRSSREWAAIHASNSKPHITFNNTKKPKQKMVGTIHTMNASSNIFNDDRQKLKQKIKNDAQKSILRKHMLKKITPNTIEASVSPIPGFLNVKATWNLK